MIPIEQYIEEAEALSDGFRPTDAGNAARLVSAADGRIRFVHAWGKWLVYSEGRWIEDAKDALVTEQAKEVSRRLFRAAVDLPAKERDVMLSWALKCELSGVITAMIRLTRGVPGVLVDHERLDADPYLFNCMNGTVDLRTGQLRPHNPDDLITMQAPVMFDAAAAAPLWQACVERWLPDPEVRRFVQRAVGSGLTGHPLESLFVNVGTGGNGKSKFYGTVAEILGPFAVTPHKSLLVATKHEGHPTHVASLFRARTLIAPETSQDDQLDEELVKNLTGGDILRARRMREDEWSFRPTHTAFMHTNYRPKIRGVDEGIWRRVRLIPWSVTIPPAERDEHLADKLRAEASGILNWIIEGALEWQRIGLAEPASVLAATAEYRTAEDHIGRFIADACIVGDTEYVSSKALRTAYENWCGEASEEPATPQKFGRDMSGRGFDSTRMGSPTARHWLGIGIR
jgi:putative DNA primase/helicase